MSDLARKWLEANRDRSEAMPVLVEDWTFHASVSTRRITPGQWRLILPCPFGDQS